MVVILRGAKGEVKLSGSSLGRMTAKPETGEGRKMTVIGTDITLMLDYAQTGGVYYTFIGSLLPGTGVPPHVHQHYEPEPRK